MRGLERNYTLFNSFEATSTVILSFLVLYVTTWSWTTLVPMDGSTRHTQRKRKHFESFQLRSAAGGHPNLR